MSARSSPLLSLLLVPPGRSVRRTVVQLPRTGLGRARARRRVAVGGWSSTRLLADLLIASTVARPSLRSVHRRQREVIAVAAAGRCSSLAGRWGDSRVKQSLLRRPPADVLVSVHKQAKGRVNDVSLEQAPAVLVGVCRQAQLANLQINVLAIVWPL